MNGQRAASDVVRLVALIGALAMPPAAEGAGRPVTFAAEDGTPLSATLYEAAGRPAPAVVLVPMLHRTQADWEGLASRLSADGITALAMDLRGHGRSGGTASDLGAMTGDVRAAVLWLTAWPSVRSGGIGLVGASLGANLALLAGAELPAVALVAVLSPSLEYRGVRVGAEVMTRLGARPVWMAASTEDPLALRTLKALAEVGAGRREQYLSTAVAHGTNLLAADESVGTALVDWLRQRLLS